MSVQTVLDTALSANAVNIGEALATTNFRAAYTAARKVRDILHVRDRRALENMCTFPLVFEENRMSTHDHTLLGAVRELIRVEHEFCLNGGLSKIECTALVVGASMREWTKYNSNGNIRYFFGDKDGKDWFRTTYDAMRAVKERLEAEVASRKGNAPRRLERITSLKSAMDKLNEKRELPDTMSFSPCPATVLISEDTILNFNEKQLCDLFEVTGASVMVGYCMAPFDFLFPDYPKNSLYELVNDVDGEVSMVFPNGYSSGYSHPAENWKMMLQDRRYYTNGNIFLTCEITCRIGPMVNFKIYRPRPNNKEVRLISVPEREHWVRVLNIWDSVDHTNHRLKGTLVYFSVVEHEFYQLINYLHSLAEKSLTVNNAVLMIRRRKNGTTLLKNEYVEPWFLRNKDVFPLAFTATIYVGQLQRDMNDVRANLNIGDWKEKFKRFFRDFARTITWPISALLDWVFALDLVDKLVLTPTHECKRYQISKIPHYDEIWQHLSFLTKVDDGSDPLPIPAPLVDSPTVTTTFDKSDEPDLVAIPPEEKPKAPECHVCTLMGECDELRLKRDPKYENKQVIECHCKDPSPTHCFEADGPYLADLVAEQHSPSENVPGALGRVIEEYKKAVRATKPFKLDVIIRVIEGGPGTGKSDFIRNLCEVYALKYGINCAIGAPFSSLEADYATRNIGGIPFSYNFKTNHRMLTAAKAHVLIIDEYTAFDYNFLLMAVGYHKPDVVYLVGDRKQTHIRPEHGVYIESKIKLNIMDTHELTTNFRNPSNIVWMLNEQFGYNMRPTKDFVPIELVEHPNEKPLLDTSIRRIFFSYAAMQDWGGFPENSDFEALKLTVKSNQGKSYDKVMIHVHPRETRHMMSDELLIVALSRTKSTMYIVYQNCPAWQQFLERVNITKYNNPMECDKYWETPTVKPRRVVCNHLVSANPIDVIPTAFRPDELARYEGILVDWNSNPYPVAGTHCGQRKLLISELRFINAFATKTCTIIYIGAAPGEHILFLVEYLLQRKVKATWHLIDPRAFHPSLQGRSDVVLHQKLATLEVMKELFQFHKKEDILLISDIRSVEDNGKVTTRCLEKDQELQLQILKQLCPRAALLKFSPEIGGKKYPYVDGHLWAQSWAGPNSREMRLVVIDPKKDNIYNMDHLCHIMDLHNVFYRGCIVSTADGDVCADCAYEDRTLTLAGYKTSQEKNDVKKWIDELLLEVHPDFRNTSHTPVYKETVPCTCYMEADEDNQKPEPKHVPPVADPKPEPKAEEKTPDIAKDTKVEKPIHIPTPANPSKLEETSLPTKVSDYQHSTVQDIAIEYTHRYNAELPDVERVPGDNDAKLMNADVGFHDVATENVFEGSKVIPVLPADILTTLKPCLVKFEHAPADAWQLIDTFGQMGMFDPCLTQDMPTMNFLHSQAPAYKGGRVDVNWEEYLYPLNDRGHPKRMAETRQKLSLGWGLTFFGSSMPQTAATMLTRYAMYKSKPKVTKEFLLLSNAMCDHYKATYKTKDFKPFAEVMFDDILVGIFCDSAVNDMFLRHYVEQALGQALDDTKTLRFAVKEIFKNVVIGKPFDQSKVAQGLCMSPAQVTAMLMVIFRMVAWYDSYTDNKDLDKDGIAMTDHTRTDLDYMTDIQSACSSLFEGRPTMTCSMDAKEADGSQGDTSAEHVDNYQRRVLGVPEYFTALFREAMKNPTLMAAFIALLTDSHTSGNILTLWRTGRLISHGITWSVTVEGKSVLAYKGDDAVIFAPKLSIDPVRYAQFKKYFGIDIYLNINQFGNFCGMLYNEAGLFPDIVRRLQRLTGRSFRNYKHFAEFQISLRDWLNFCQNVGIERVLEANARAHKLELDTVLNMYYCLDSWSHVNKQVYDQNMTTVTQDSLVLSQNHKGEPVFEDLHFGPAIPLVGGSEKKFGLDMYWYNKTKHQLLKLTNAVSSKLPLATVVATTILVCTNVKKVVNICGSVLEPVYDSLCDNYRYYVHFQGWKNTWVAKKYFSMKRTLTFWMPLQTTTFVALLCSKFGRIDLAHRIFAWQEAKLGSPLEVWYYHYDVAEYLGHTEALPAIVQRIQQWEDYIYGAEYMKKLRDAQIRQYENEQQATQDEKSGKNSLKEKIVGMIGNSHSTTIFNADNYSQQFRTYPQSKQSLPQRFQCHPNRSFTPPTRSKFSRLFLRLGRRLVVLPICPLSFLSPSTTERNISPKPPTNVPVRNRSILRSWRISNC